MSVLSCHILMASCLLLLSITEIHGFYLNADPRFATAEVKFLSRPVN